MTAVQVPIAEACLARTPASEAMMRRAETATPGVLKARAACHGSYGDLEAGLHGQGEIRGRVWLAEFGDLGSFRRVMEEHGTRSAR